MVKAGGEVGRLSIAGGAEVGVYFIILCACLLLTASFFLYLFSSLISLLL